MEQYAAMITTHLEILFRKHPQEHRGTAGLNMRSSFDTFLKRSSFSVVSIYDNEVYHSN